jgi:SecD/SecF fusion protein
MVDGEVISAPTIQSKFGDRFQVTGDFKQKEAIELATSLSNPLENPLKIVQASQTSPTYGKSVINQGVTAGIVGLAATLLFMVIYYRLAGLIAVIGLLVNLILLLAAMIVFDFTLTMPGIAGMLLTLGIAVDANVLIYERMREEFAAGKSFNGAIRASYDKAFTAIFDSNLTSLITSVIMILVATGAVKGFGVTLTVGILASLFSALLISRVCFSWLEKMGLQKLSFLSLISNKYIDFMSKRRGFIISSFVLAGLALAVLAYKGQRSLGYELRGGDLITISGVSEDEVTNALKDLKEVSVKVSDKESKMEPFSMTAQTIKPVNEAEFINLRTNFQHGAVAMDAIKKSLGDKAKLGNVEAMGPAVGGAMLRDSILAVIYGLIGIFIYLTVRYEVPFAIGGIVALSHDVIIAAGVCALCGREIGMILIGAFLTISGYSINDTIVIFDRIRENLRTSTTDLATTMNQAISATLSRTILTSGVTLIVVVAMYFFGGPAMNDFSFAMLVGILIGTYSSIFVASPLVLWWATKRKLNLQKAILDADAMRLEAMSGMEKEAPESASFVEQE